MTDGLMSAAIPGSGLSLDPFRLSLACRDQNEGEIRWSLFSGLRLRPSSTACERAVPLAMKPLRRSERNSSPLPKSPTAGAMCANRIRFALWPPTSRQAKAENSLSNTVILSGIATEYASLLRDNDRALPSKGRGRRSAAVGKLSRNICCSRGGGGGIMQTEDRYRVLDQTEVCGVPARPPRRTARAAHRACERAAICSVLYSRRWRQAGPDCQHPR
jgi:hypothetical protein